MKTDFSGRWNGFAITTNTTPDVSAASPVLPWAGSRVDGGRGPNLVAGRAMKALLQLAAAAGVFELDRCPVRRRPAITPRSEGENDRLQVAALFRKPVFVKRLVFRVHMRFHETSGDETVETGCEDV